MSYMKCPKEGMHYNKPFPAAAANDVPICGAHAQRAAVVVHYARDAICEIENVGGGGGRLK